MIRAVYYDGTIYEGQATKNGPHGWGRMIYARRKVPKALRKEFVVCCQVDTVAVNNMDPK